MGQIIETVAQVGSALGGGGLLGTVVSSLASNLIGSAFSGGSESPSAPPPPAEPTGKSPEEVAAEEAARIRGLRRRQGSSSGLGLLASTPQTGSTPKTLLGQ